MSYFAVVAVIVSYLLLVRALRYRRRDEISRRYPQYQTREEMASMSISEAASVLKELGSREFPTTFYTSVSFALFKTYGIPTISKLLVATSQLSGDTTASKRRTDTGVLMSEIIWNTPDSRRNIDAIARINFLHSRWRQAGKISNDDMLFTLGLFVLEPIRWTALYEWRDLTMFEKNAMAIFWRDLGNEMGISYECLVPYMRENKDALAWVEALQKWCSKYQEHHMVYAVSNTKLAHANVKLLLMDFPRFTQNFVLRQLRCLMEPRLRQSMGYEDPSRLDSYIFENLVAIRRAVLKHLSLPRPKWWTYPMILDADKKTGRFYVPTYLAHPYYVKPSFYSRWGPSALYTRLVGGYLPGDQGSKFHPEGYTIPEVGPESQRCKGQEYMCLERQRIEKSRGCPMAFQA
ncbi:Putative ER-bound oxygenase mpaB/mpaB'/Rubber oxygenase, catalytic domain-containing protein [Colletotrichum destructivum]|uniref:ER-bound oxygenase mpaB/mpaB'/Rubber oxygenase, catalytic domain-containing protein n=1 Tax=Colletotrichum destructivum TaxID=34406 RepID=A0AAX4HW72_9PEZI|nr:Putative ER-bound oxygenase mpaB/mpaB'/Rubber oxygenase, catalytic domain-containing protein [Colletotrichum destructivum]